MRCVFCVSYFNPLAPRGARLCRYSAMASSSRISIHSPLAGRDRKIPGTDRYLGISIHSPLAGRDADGVDVLPDAVRISIHSPLAGRDGGGTVRGPHGGGFQSTRPSRGETPAPPMPAAPQTISIHSPLAGRDFNAREVDGQLVISIHSPLAGRDIRAVHLCHLQKNFNPLAPRGARHLGCLKPENPAAFQSTRPSRGETAADVRLPVGQNISIHSPLAGRDPARLS